MASDEDQGTVPPQAKVPSPSPGAAGPSAAGSSAASGGRPHLRLVHSQPPSTGEPEDGLSARGSVELSSDFKAELRADRGSRPSIPSMPSTPGVPRGSEPPPSSPGPASGRASASMTNAPIQPQVMSARRQQQLRDAYVFGARLLLDQPAACRIGYRLFWVHGRDLGWLDLEAVPSVYAVLGYHENCDLQLPRQSGISNRHLLASCFQLSDGTPVLRLLDLHTSTPFTIEGQPRQSICVSGPLLVGLGDVALGCVPLPEFHQQSGALSDGYELPSYTTSESELPPETSQRMARRTHITLMPRSARLEDIKAPPSSLMPSAPGHARFTLRRDARAVSVEVSEADLYAGVLIGRAETCLDRGLRQVLSGQISRLHVLIMAERGRVYAMDLCSTNGTWLGGRRVRRVPLADAGTRLVLSGNDSKVELTWHPRAGSSGPGGGGGGPHGDDRSDVRSGLIPSSRPSIVTAQDPGNTTRRKD